MRCTPIFHIFPKTFSPSTTKKNDEKQERSFQDPWLLLKKILINCKVKLIRKGLLLNSLQFVRDLTRSMNLDTRAIIHFDNRSFFFLDRRVIQKLFWMGGRGGRVRTGKRILFIIAFKISGMEGYNYSFEWFVMNTLIMFSHGNLNRIIAKYLHINFR